MDSARERAAEQAASDTPSYVRGEVIVRYDENVTSSARQDARRAARGEDVRELRGLPDSEIIELDSGISVKGAIKTLSQRPGVRYAQPNYLYTTDAVPTDPRYGELWGMNNTGQTGGTIDADIDAPEAWDLSTGSSDVVVAVIDSGVDVSHPDLAANIWVNPGEIPNNNIDDDLNGWTDDVNGYDFRNNDGEPDDQDGHGTHVSGTVAAAMNNGVGVVGVAPDTKIMALKFIGQTSGSTSDAIDAVDYAQAMGADVLNCSWGGGSYDQSLADSIAAFDGLVVCAAGNEGTDVDPAGNEHYPSSYTLPNVISVASTDDEDQLYTTSNYGAVGVDVAAPGARILSTLPGPGPTFETDVESVIFSDDFSNLDNWTSVSHAGLDTWAIDTSRYDSPPSSVSLPDYQNDQNAWLTLNGPIDLSSVAGAALRLDVDYDTEEIFDALDVWAHDGTEWVYLETYAGESDGFESQWIDLTFMAGESSTTVAFQFTSDGSFGGDQGFDGVYIDDVEIVETSPLFFEDMTTLAAWETTSLSGLDEWGLYTDIHVSPPSMAAHTPYLNNEDSWLILDSPVDLSSVSGGIAMRHVLFYDTEAGFDYLSSWASTDKVSWSALDSHSGYSHGWARETLDLSAYAGGPLYIAFSLSADSEIDSTDPAGYLGGFIDDVVIETGSWSTVDYSSSYAVYTGTSMASPHVAGLVALLRAHEPGLSTAEIKQRIFDTADPLPTLAGKVLTGARINAYRALANIPVPDTTAPALSDNAKTLYQDSASITLSATDATTVASVTYSLDGGSDVITPGSEVVVNVSDLGSHSLRYFAEDALGNVSTPKSLSFTIERGDIAFELIAGETRYETAVEASQDSFASGAPAVVVATGRSWPDALGGSALAGVVNGPVLLTDPNTLPATVASEISRLGASKVYILGGTGAVSTSVSIQLGGIVGSANVERIGGANRYETARLTADKVIALSDSYDGKALVATGGSFPDALAGSPLAYAKGRPLLLASKTSVSLPPQVDEVVVLGGTGAVSSAAEAYLDKQLGAANVTRVAGADRYGTAVEVAEYAVGEGLQWDGSGLATGANFPDALAGGAALGAGGSVMLLTRTGILPAPTESALEDHRDEIKEFTFIGGSGAISEGVRYLVQVILD